MNRFKIQKQTHLGGFYIARLNILCYEELHLKIPIGRGKQGSGVRVEGRGVLLST